jgi:hypothetical protein
MSKVTGKLKENVQYCHEHGKPELLCAQQGIGVDPPLPKRDIVRIS